MSIYCSCTSQGTSCQKYTQTLNSQIGLSNDRLNSIDRTWLYLFFALAPARALAVKNIYANLELTNQFLLIIDPTGSCLFFCSCTSQGTSCQKYTQTLNSHMCLSQKLIEVDWSNLIVFIFCSCTSQGTSCQKYLRKPWTHKSVSLNNWSNSIMFIFWLLYQPGN